MTSSRDVLRRVGARVPVPQPAFDRLMRRRARRRRNQRIASGVFAAILAAGAMGAAIRVLHDVKQRQIPAHGQITPDNIGQLRLLGSPQVGGHIVSVQVSDGLVYVVSREEHSVRFVAFSADCSRSCTPAWIGDVGDARPRGGSAAGDGMVYVATDELYAFSASCGSGGSVCEPAWVGHVQGRAFDPVLGNGAVFVATEQRLYSFPTSCASTGGSCVPNWVAKLVPVGFNHPLVVGGTIYLFDCCDAPSTGWVAFPTDCGTGGAICKPLASAPPPPPLQTIADGESFIGNVDRGTISAYPPTCALGLGAKNVKPADCQPLWTSTGFSSDRGGFIAPGGGLLYVFQHFGGCCAGIGNGGGILAYPTRCGTEDASCRPV
jgi:hypothetical protein